MFSIGFPHVRQFPLPKITGVTKFVGNGIFNQSKKLWITFPFWYLTGSGQWRINPWASSTRYIFLARVLLMSLHLGMSKPSSSSSSSANSSKAFFLSLDGVLTYLFILLVIILWIFL